MNTEKKTYTAKRTKKNKLNPLKLKIMLRMEIIGNLGADALVQSHNGNKFVSFRVAHTDQWTDQKTGEIHSTTQWVSCAMNGDGGRILAWLKKGTKVYVRGIPNFVIYSSPKTHMMECGINLSIRDIELCGIKQQNKQEEVKPL